MKKITKKLLVLLLMACMILPYTSPITAHAVSTQEAYYLSVLNPGSAKGRVESYPVKLVFNAFGTYHNINDRLEFKGTLGINTGIDDETMLSILEDALSSVEGYEELQDAVDDKVLAEQSLEKLKVSQEDVDKMIENWQKILGIDNVVTLLSGNLPNIGASDAINAVIDGAQGNIPGLPGVPGIGNVIDTAFISYEQWQKDKEKYKDIVNAYNANRRLDAYYVRVSELMTEERADESSWTLKIEAQDSADFEFHKIHGNTQLWTADIELKKRDGSYGNVSGAYDGHFNLTMDCDLSTFDNEYPEYVAQYANKHGKVDESDSTTWPSRMTTYLVKVFGSSWSVADNSGSDSSLYCSFEIPDCNLLLELPRGANKAFFEIYVDSSLVYMTEYSISVNRQVTFRQDWPKDNEPDYQNSQIIINDHDITVKNDGDIYLEDSETFKFDQKLDMTLVIDMLGD